MTVAKAPPQQWAASRPIAGIVLFVAAMVLFASGDGVMKVALGTFTVPQVMMVRLWAFLLLAVVFVSLRGGIVRALRTRHPVLQIVRGLLLVVDTALFSTALHHIGLSETHAIYASGPLMATALAVPLLGEDVGWRRWTAVLVGFAGALLIIRPGADLLASASIFALAGAACYALFSVLTRRVSLRDPIETSFLYVALVGVIATTPLGIASWRTPDATGALLLATLTATSLTAHILLLRAYATTPATILQPFSYFALATATIIGIAVFGEVLHPLAIAGTLIVVASGLYVAWRERVRVSGRVSAQRGPGR